MYNRRSVSAEEAELQKGRQGVKKKKEEGEECPTEIVKS